MCTLLCNCVCPLLCDMLDILAATQWGWEMAEKQSSQCRNKTVRRYNGMKIENGGGRGAGVEQASVCGLTAVGAAAQ